ncbi:50S ribosomal protein L25 [Candidatus Binatia bacterium]|nr:50S ribosomal protein L25 [Candidatus Binatia bacterium]
MEAIEFNVEVRGVAGKGAARRARRTGRVPGIFYGPKRQSTPVMVDAKEFAQKVVAVEGSQLLRLASGSDEVNGRISILKDTQYHPVTGAVLHADFYEVDLQQALQVRVPLHFVGKPPGVAAGGILQPLRREVEVQCLPLDIPHAIDVDVSNLGIHDSIHISALTPPAGAKFVFEDDFGLVTVLPPTVEEVKTEAVAEGAPAEGATPGEPAKTEGEK